MSGTTLSMCRYGWGTFVLFARWRTQLELERLGHPLRSKEGAPKGCPSVVRPSVKEGKKQSADVTALGTL
jgi:hypothetical protein